MKNFKLITTIITVAFSTLSASANELVPQSPVGNEINPVAADARSPLTDWNSQTRRAEQTRRRERSRSNVGDRTFTSMIDIGAGAENAIHAAGIDLNSGWNVLVSVRAQIDTDDPRPRPPQGGPEAARGDRGRLGDNRLMFLHVDGRMAVNPNDSSDRVPYLDVKLVPVSLTAIDENNSNTMFLGVNFLQSSVHRDVRLGRDYRFAITAVGIDVRHQTEINENIDFLLAAAANILGVRMQDAFSTYSRPPLDNPTGTLRPNGPGVQINSAELMMSLLFHNADRAWGGRITLGARSSLGMVWTREHDSINEEEGNSRAVALDVDTYAEAALRLGRFVELFSRISIMHLRENGQYDPAQTRSITQFMTGASLQF